MQIRPATPEEMLNRGVYFAPYLVKGFPALVAIDSRQWAVKHFVLRPTTDERMAWARMEQWLERFDPVPQLKLVTAERTSTSATSAGRPKIDPRAYEDHVAFALRMARERVRRFRPYE